MAEKECDYCGDTYNSDKHDPFCSKTCEVSDQNMNGD